MCVGREPVESCVICRSYIKHEKLEVSTRFKQEGGHLKLWQNNPKNRGVKTRKDRT